MMRRWFSSSRLLVLLGVSLAVNAGFAVARWPGRSSAAAGDGSATENGRTVKVARGGRGAGRDFSGGAGGGSGAAGQEKPETAPVRVDVRWLARQVEDDGRELTFGEGLGSLLEMTPAQVRAVEERMRGWVAEGLRLEAAHVTSVKTRRWVEYQIQVPPEEGGALRERIRREVAEIPGLRDPEAVTAVVLAQKRFAGVTRENDGSEEVLVQQGPDDGPHNAPEDCLQRFADGTFGDRGPAMGSAMQTRYGHFIDFETLRTSDDWR
ncbi:MAG: hypothetical protein JWO82_2697 [Akkermansiaceae bacterium]|nr:hypothetical protein [Akkermansiaceae bacterium]